MYFVIQNNNGSLYSITKDNTLITATNVPTILYNSFINTKNNTTSYQYDITGSGYIYFAIVSKNTILTKDQIETQQITENIISVSNLLINNSSYTSNFTNLIKNTNYDMCYIIFNNNKSLFSSVFIDTTLKTENIPDISNIFLVIC
jgi:hypothetical protein